MDKQEVVEQKIEVTPEAIHAGAEQIIEVTPEMIEAGRDALAQFDPEYLLDWEVVQSVYYAMEREKATQDC